MGFDLGSFTGGIIGSLGAYLVARYTIKEQSKKEQPKIDKNRYNLCSRIESEIDKLEWNLVGGDFENHSESMEMIILFLSEIKKIIPDAIEADSEIVKLLNDIDRDVRNYNIINWPEKPVRERTNATYVKEICGLLRRYKEALFTIKHKIVNQI